MPYIARFNGRCTYNPSSRSVNIVMMLVRSSWVNGSRWRRRGNGLRPAESHQCVIHGSTAPSANS